MTDVPGVAAPYPVAPGVAKAQQLKAAGFSDGEVAQWAQGQTAKLQAGGFKADEIDHYWGNSVPANAALSAHVATNYTAYANQDPKLAQTPWDAFAAGWDRSVTGLIVNRRAPTTVLPQNASITNKVLNAVGQFAGDAPASVAGFFGGAAAGTTAGAAVPVGGETGVTEAIGAVGGAGFGMGATPEASRQILLDAYALHDGKIKTWQDATHVIASSLWETTKAGIVGAVTNMTGGPVAGKLEAMGASKLVSSGVAGTATVATSVGTASALDGHMPDAADFTTAALLTLGLHGLGAAHAAAKGGLSDKVGRVQSNLETLYRQTGTPPWEAAARAARDPIFKQELYAQDPQGDPVAPQTRNAAPADPPPYNPDVREAGLVPEHQVGWLQPETMRNITPKKGPFSPPSETPAASEPGTALVSTGPNGYAQSPAHAKEMLRQLEGSGDDAVSPKGAIGRYQIMPATARQYMGNDFDVHTLFDPKVNSAVADRIVADLYKRYAGNMNAIAIAYNAGPGRAGEYMKAGPGSALDAVPDKTVRGGIRYETKPAARDESFLPTETQKYLANERRRTGGGGGGEGPPGAGEEPKVPSYSLATTGGGAGGGGEPPSGGPPAVGGEPPEEEHTKFWAKASESAATDEMLRNIGEDPKAPSVFNLDRIASQFVSELSPARAIDNRLIKAGEMDRTRDLGAEDMFRQTYASDMRTGAFIKYGEIDPITLKLKVGSPSIMDAIKSVKDKGGDLQGFTAYLLAKRTVDKMGQGIDTGFNPEAATNLASQKGAIKKYEDASILWNSVMDGVLRYSRDSGVHSQADIDAMMRDNPAYISMRRIMGDDASFQPGGGRTFSATDPLRRMEGSDRQIVDPIAATLDNMRLIVKMADRNRAIGHIIGQIERGEIENPGLLKIEDSQTIKNPDESVFKPYGLPPEATPGDTYSAELAQRQMKGGNPNDFLFMRDGKPEVWRATDPALARLLRGADSPGEADFITKTFQTFASLERSGIVISPDFPTKVQLRHQITAFIMDPLHPPPFLTWLNGISHVIKQDDLYKQAISTGALGVSLADMDANWLARDMDKVFTETNTWSGVTNALQHPIQFAQIVSERMDAAARIGYIKQAQAQGIDSIKAATMSRKAYLDYAERGTSVVVQRLAQAIPFFRPHLLGMKQGFEGFEPNKPGETMWGRTAETAAYSVAGVALPMIALYALNYFQDKDLPDDRKFANEPQFLKDNYFTTPEIAGVRFRLKTPPNVGFVLGGLVNRFLDFAVQHDQHAFEGWAKQFLDQYIPPLMPTVVQAPLEVAANHSFYTGQSLVPGSMEKDSGYMQYTPATSETGKALSRVLGPPGLDVANFSPIQFDHLVQGWTGTLGAAALKALDMPITAVQHVTDSPWEVGKKPGQAADLPFVGSFLARNPGTSAAPISKFYDLAQKIEAEHADFALAMKRVQTSGSTAEIDQTAASGQYATAIAPIKEAIARQTAVIQGINANKNMTADEKRQATDQLMPQIIATAKQGINAIDDIGRANAATSPAGPPASGGGLPAHVAPEPMPAAPQAPARPPVAPTVGANRGEVPVA
jgi:soluble lytic murein transglycosylase-like protein